MTSETRLEEEKRDLLRDSICCIEKDALFSDESEMFLSPSEPDPGDLVTFRMRTRRLGVDEVFWVSGQERIPMKRAYCGHGLDYYVLEREIGSDTLLYYYEIRCENEVCFYGRRGPFSVLGDRDYFRIIPGFHIPDWAKGAVMYQIYVDRFYNGDKTNDVVDNEYAYINQPVQGIQDWNQMPEAMDVRNFYGGDLQGVMEKLDYLQDLGVEVIYLNPIFVSPSNHKYDTQDYDYVDPHFGKIVVDAEGVLEGGLDNKSSRKYVTRVTDIRNLEASNDLFIRLVEEIHKRGMKVILDGVFNHCGSFNKWLDREQIYEGSEGYAKGAYVAHDSPYHNYFQFDQNGRWPYNGAYSGWWGHDTLPKLNYEGSKELEEDILRIGRKWVSPPYNIDGWRLDVAADLGLSPEYNHYFWGRFREEVRKANPDAIVLAEHYGDPSGWLNGKEWDSVMNYDAFMEPVTYFLTGMEKHSDSYAEGMLGNSQAFDQAMKENMAAFPRSSLLMAMNELDNHDHSRFLTRTNHLVGRVGELGSESASEGVNKAILREAVLMQMTWPGAPTLYYGDEAGVCGYTDPDNRRTYPWGNEDEELIRFYKEAIKLHKQYPMLRTGSLKTLYMDENILVYARFNESQQIIVAINNQEMPLILPVPVWKAGLCRKNPYLPVMEVMSTDHWGFSAEKKQRYANEGVLPLQMSSYSAVVLVHED